MAKWIITIQQVLEVEAPSMARATKIVRDDPPYISWFSSDGESVKSRKKVDVVKISPRSNNRVNPDKGNAPGENKS